MEVGRDAACEALWPSDWRLRALARKTSPSLNDWLMRRIGDIKLESAPQGIGTEKPHSTWSPRRRRSGFRPSTSPRASSGCPRLKATAGPSTRTAIDYAVLTQGDTGEAKNTVRPASQPLASRTQARPRRRGTPAPAFFTQRQLPDEPDATSNALCACCQVRAEEHSARRDRRGARTRRRQSSNWRDWRRGSGEASSKADASA